MRQSQIAYETQSIFRSAYISAQSVQLFDYALTSLLRLSQDNKANCVCMTPWRLHSGTVYF